MRYVRFARIAAMALLTAMTLGTTACIAPDARYEREPAPEPVKSGELTGDWKGWRGSALELVSGGRATVTKLDGQSWDFDDGWRMTGKGTWRHEQNILVVSVKANDVAERPRSADDPGVPLPSPNPEEFPKEYRWQFKARHGEKGRLEIYFFTGDPDTRDAYVMWQAG